MSVHCDKLTETNCVCELALVSGCATFPRGMNLWTERMPLLSQSFEFGIDPNIPYTPQTIGFRSPVTFWRGQICASFFLCVSGVFPRVVCAGGSRTGPQH